MPELSIKNVKIVGVAACVPSKIEENISLSVFRSKDEAEAVIKATGIERHRISDENVTASDLSVRAINSLIVDLKWDIKEIDALIYVCTSRDYITPMTSCILQNRLGMRNDSFVIDIPMGCSGWVYGMSVLSSLMQNGMIKRGLLVNSETNTKNRSAKDKTSKPLFGDAATVTCLEFDNTFDKPMNFIFGVDGSGAESVMARYGGCRNPVTVDSLREVEIEPGIVRKGTDIVMDGMDVFSFAINQPPKSIKELISKFKINLDTIDFLLLHQANKYIDERIRKTVNISEDKTPYCLNDFGNVSGASIPLTMVTRIKEALSTKSNHCICCGFGVGLSWASIELYINSIVVSDLIIY